MDSSVKTFLNFGAFSGLCSFIFFLMLYFIGWNPLGQASWLGAWIPVLFICLATRYNRDRISDGIITYGQAFRIGFLTASSGGFLFALLIYIFGTYISPDLVDIYKTDILDGLEKTRAIFGEKFYDMSIENLDKTTMFNISTSDFFSKAIGGLVVSLITAGFYRRPYKYQEKETNE